MATIAFGSRAGSTLLFLAATFRLLRLFLPVALRLKLAEVVVEAVEALLPELAVILEPLVDAAQRLRLDLARPPLRLPAAGDEARVLQHLQVLRDGGEADRERGREFGHGRLTCHEAGEDRAAGGVGQGVQRGLQGDHSI